MKMPPNTADYTYHSVLPFMFSLIRDKSRGFKGDLDENQQKLWLAVWELKDQVNKHPQYGFASSNIRQYYLELWCWMKFWDTPFPGVFPGHQASVRTAAFGPTSNLPSYTSPNQQLSIRDNMFNRQEQYTVQPYITTPPPDIQPPPARNQIEYNLTDEQRATIVNKILEHKHQGYVPQHGWDEKTGLPRYAVICTAPNAFNCWNGPNTSIFNVIRAEFAPFRIMFQRLPQGLISAGRGNLIIYPEAGPLIYELSNGDGSEWNAFRNMWAFLRTWADQGNETGMAENAVRHMVECRDEWLNYDSSHLVPPLVIGGGEES